MGRGSRNRHGGASKKAGRKQAKKEQLNLESKIRRDFNNESICSAVSNGQEGKCFNFVSQAGPGCYIARKSEMYEDGIGIDDWVFGWEDIDPDDYHGCRVPDIAVDPEERILTLCNIQDVHVVAYITVYKDVPIDDTSSSTSPSSGSENDKPLTPPLSSSGVVRLSDNAGQELMPGRTVNNEGVEQACTTMIVVCPPRTFAHLCSIEIDRSMVDEKNTSSSSSNNNNNNNSTWEQALLELDCLRIDSDVQEWNRHSNPSDFHSQSIKFPFAPNDGPFLCTQGVGGFLTHFFGGNLHAIDFQCPIGTKLLAVGNGVVLEATDKNQLTGIAVTNLFKWNSILIQLDRQKTESNESSEEGDDENDDGPLFVEYVHISTCAVSVGDRVTTGQVIGTSGSVGFSPEPHLHFAAYRSSELTAETVGVHFSPATANPNKLFSPAAGNWYNATGPVNAAARETQMLLSA